MSNSMWPHRRQPTRLLWPWDSPGKNIGVSCHVHLQSTKVKSLSHVWLLVTAWTVAHQVLPSMGFSRQEYWSGLPLPSPVHPNITEEKKFSKIILTKELWSSTMHIITSWDILSQTELNCVKLGHFCFHLPLHSLLWHNSVLSLELHGAQSENHYSSSALLWFSDSILSDSWRPHGL